MMREILVTVITCLLNKSSKEHVLKIKICMAALKKKPNTADLLNEMFLTFDDSIERSCDYTLLILE